MKYFWIIVILALIVSPLMAMRSSPREKRQQAVRQLAGQQGLCVQLARRPDARDDERDLDSTCYRLPWEGKPPESLRNWVLTHNSSRGMAAEWAGWRWFEGPAPGRLEAALGKIIEQLPEGTTGLVVDRAGVGLHWDERGGEQQVAAVADGLKALREAVLGLQ